MVVTWVASISLFRIGSRDQYYLTALILVVMTEHTAKVAFRPGNDALAYLPEGPCQYGEGKLSWVAIQHGGESCEGSINVLDLGSGSNQQHILPGRPGFAFPTEDQSVFLAGIERKVGFYNISSGQWVEPPGEVSGEEDGTIINDGVAYRDGVIFGTKDLAFTDPKAALYLWLPEMREPVKLRGGQTCSNGKIILTREGKEFLLDIDTPTKLVVEYPLDGDGQQLGEPKTVLDLREVASYPDGMVMTPDGRSVIIAMYNPENVEEGEARQHSLVDGRLEAVWKTPGSPRVTCPLLMPIEGESALFLTTAVEHMPEDQKVQHPNAGCLFRGEFPT